MLLNPSSQVTSALHIINNLAARIAGKNIFSKQHHLTIWENNLTILSHHAQTVSVTIEGKAEFIISSL